MVGRGREVPDGIVTFGFHRSIARKLTSVRPFAHPFVVGCGFLSFGIVNSLDKSEVVNALSLEAGGRVVRRCVQTTTTVRPGDSARSLASLASYSCSVPWERRRHRDLDADRAHAARSLRRCGSSGNPGGVWRQIRATCTALSAYRCPLVRNLSDGGSARRVAMLLHRDCSRVNINGFDVGRGHDGLASLKEAGQSDERAF
jgi:hypothetical protein